jgi:trans-aconitate methyltransferase
MDKNQGAVALFNEFAEAYQEKYMSVDLYRETLDVFCAAIEPVGAKVLELGCGPGNITRYLLDKRPDLQLLGTDLAPRMMTLARINNPGAEFRLMDCRDLAQLKELYDAIVGGFCLPYLSKKECLDLIRNAALCLNSTGIIYLSTMEDDYEKSGFVGASSGGEKRMFTYYHEAGYLKEALAKNGFSILSMKRQNYPTYNSTTKTDLIIIARLETAQK